MTTHVTDTPPSSAPQATPQAAAAEPAANGKSVPDRELLRRFVRLGDQAAFATLVRRHSGLVIGVCRRVLRSEHDIEDAFQATFLVLARDAGRIRRSDSLASWLHGVAYRTSLRAADSTRRRGRLLRELTMIEDTHTPADDSGLLADVEQRHQQQALDEELASLPDNYRAALVLHYLDGKSNQQVADELNLSVAAVESRLKRGRKELRLRLARRGIGLSVAVAAMQAVQSSAQAAIQLEPLIARAIDAGLSYAGGEAAGPVYSPEAARLAGQELMTMSTTTTATLAAVVLLPLALSFAGHTPVAGVSNSSGAVNTVLAQIDVEADESESPDSGAIDLNVHETEVGASFIDPVTGTEFGFSSGGDEGQQLGAGSVSAVRMTSVDEAAGKVTISYTKDGKDYFRVVDLAQEDARSADAAPTTALGFGMAGMGMMMGDYSDMAGAGAGMMPSGGYRPPVPAGIRDYTDTPASEQRIADVLKQPAEVEFVDTPLRDVMEFLATQNDIPILIDEVALNDVGVPTDEPVNLALTGVTLQTALNHILRPQGLTTIIRDEVLQVTTKEVADEYLVTRVYDISDLAEIEQEQLLQVLQESLPDADWKDNGGGGTASILDDALVVKQSQSAHRQIVDLVGQLRRHLADRSAHTRSSEDR
jgi:RNA polymerase sigma factor (sigma-70 family)